MQNLSFDLKHFVTDTSVSETQEPSHSNFMGEELFVKISDGLFKNNWIWLTQYLSFVHRAVIQFRLGYLPGKHSSSWPSWAPGSRVSGRDRIPQPHFGRPCRCWVFGRLQSYPSKDQKSIRMGQKSIRTGHQGQKILDAPRIRNLSEPVTNYNFLDAQSWSEIHSSELVRTKSEISHKWSLTHPGSEIDRNWSEVDQKSIRNSPGFLYLSNCSTGGGLSVERAIDTKTKTCVLISWSACIIGEVATWKHITMQCAWHKKCRACALHRHARSKTPVHKCHSQRWL